MKNVSFTGHREIRSEYIKNELFNTLTDLIEKGAEAFYAGGAAGFDMIAAETVIELRNEYPWIRLVLLLPCPPEEQTAKFSPKNKEMYYHILKAADKAETISPTYTNDCMKKRNQRLIDIADVCVCCYDTKRTNTGTGQTVRMAQKKGIEIINLLDRISLSWH